MQLIFDNVVCLGVCQFSVCKNIFWTRKAFIGPIINMKGAQNLSLMETQKNLIIVSLI